MKKIVRITAVLMVLILAVGTFAACSLVSPEKKLEGKWVDTSGLNSGYEFLEDGKLKITYINFNIPIINQTFDGTVDGIYVVSKQDKKDIVTMTYTVLLRSVQETYEFSVDNGILTLTNIENGKQTLLKKGEVTTSAAQ